MHLKLVPARGKDLESDNNSLNMLPIKPFNKGNIVNLRSVQASLFAL